MKVNKIKILIFSAFGTALLIIIGWFVSIYYSTQKPKGTDAVNLGLDVDTKYTYKDMLDSKNKNEAQETYEYRNIPTKEYSAQNDSSSPEQNQYAEEQQQIKTVMYNIKNQKENPSQEINYNNTPQKAINKPVSTQLASFGEIDYGSVEQPKSTKQATTREELFNDSSGDISNSHSETIISAVIHGEQSIRNGSSVKIRTTQDCLVEGTLIPKNTFVFGQVRISDNRINININGFKINGTILTVPLAVYDEDGSIGLKLIAGSGEGITDKAIDVADGSSRNILSDVPIIGGVAQAAKDIIRSRSSKDKLVVLASNYKLTLKKS